ncbi:TetR/AcrR family transcriptional regulator [Actinomadura sp. B10D3]|uniref:TetR/AcrR family transcriptional regulator n=1 Tax=Actinomadura sp. B10D3 TaxID=3153557 RepID=UPI00325E82D8
MPSSSDPVVESPAPLGRRERKKLQTKERIVDCAVALFASRGYDSTTMEDIGEGADVSRATVFNYFARKEDIVIEVFARRRARLAEIVAEAMEQTDATPGRLRRALTGLARLNQDEPAAGRAIARAWLRAGGPLMPNATDSAALFTDIVRTGQRQGDVPPDLDATRAGLVILDTYLGVLFRWVDDEDGRYDFEENLLATLDLLLTGITRDPRA